VGNPANTNALITLSNAPDIDPRQFTAMTRLDHNRAIAQLAEKTSNPLTDISRMTIWGNHSATQYPDLFNAKVGNQIATEIIEREWYENEFIPSVQQRGAAIISARGASSAASAANAAIDHMRTWAMGTSDDDWTSMAVVSTGAYDIAEGIIYSFPCRCLESQWSIVEDLEINEFSLGKMKSTEKELVEERDAIAHLL